VAIEFNTLSKAYNMAGWRIGAALGNPLALQALYSVLTGLTSGSFHAVNEAAIAALIGDQSWIVNRNAVYQRRRDLALRTLQNLGWAAEMAQAALYIWFHIPPGYTTSAEFCLALLDGTGVSLTPGSVFGPHGEGYVRLSFTLPEQILQKALARLGQL
jgi:LL-diaminopimelate aminotransferase